MADLILTPAPHQVFNEFDRLGLLLGLPRLENERNLEYKQRLFDVFVHRAGSIYIGIIHGMTRELGLELFHAMTIQTNSNALGEPVSASPAVVFRETDCIVYSDITAETIHSTFDRFDPKGTAYTLQELASKINITGLFVATVPAAVQNLRSMTVFNQSNVILVPSEEVDRAASRVKLANNNLIANTIALRSPNLVERVGSQQAIVASGQYYIDPILGIVYSFDAPSPGTRIRYKYRNDKYKVIGSPVILHNLQSTEFKKKMFEQVGTAASPENGLPTELGADIINELLSVFPSALGE